MGKRGGSRKGAGRKKGIGLANDIKNHCEKLISTILLDEAIRHKAVAQVALNLESEKQDYLYILENNGLYKIGYTSNFKRRIKDYKIHLGIVNVAYLTKQFNCLKLEEDLHKLFNSKLKTGEWFKLSTNDLLEAIKYCSSKIH